MHDNDSRNVKIQLDFTTTKLEQMKKFKNYIFIAYLATLTSTQAQTDPKPKTEVTKNFLDLQASTLGNIFGDSLTGGNGKVTNYLELVNKSGRPESEKQKLREAYLLYSKTLDAQGKDSLQSAMVKELMLKTKKDTLN